MDDPSPNPRVPTPAQEMTVWIAGALITLACFGFLPRLAAASEFLDLSRLRSETLLFGLFHVSALHNVFHLVLGAAALASAGTHRSCRQFLAIAGALMLALVLYGQIDQAPLVPDLVPAGLPDTWLHTVLALTMFMGAVLPGARR